MASEYEELKEESFWSRLAKLARSGTLILGVLGMLGSALALFESLRSEQAANKAFITEIEASATVTLLEARDTLRDVQNLNASLSSLLASVAQKASELPNANDRSDLSHQIEDYQKILGRLNDRVTNSLGAIDRYERGHRDNRSYNSTIISHAFAAEAPASPGVSIDTLRPMIMLGVIGAISLFFFICLGLYCLTSDADKIKFADNMLRTIVGFYIGIVTGLLGLPGK